MSEEQSHGIPQKIINYLEVGKLFLTMKATGGALIYIYFATKCTKPLKPSSQSHGPHRAAEMVFLLAWESFHIRKRL